MNIREYITGGHAAFTVVSGKTGHRYTFRAMWPRSKRWDATAPLFVSVRGHGEDAWNYLGTIFAPAAAGGQRQFMRTRKSAFAADSPECRAFEWLWRNADDTRGQVEFLPSGKCICCGRELTEPESIARSVGPECWARKQFPRAVRSGSARGAGRLAGGTAARARARAAGDQQLLSIA